jgi:hypothetical protein
MRHKIISIEEDNTGKSKSKYSGCEEVAIFRESLIGRFKIKTMGRKKIQIEPIRDERLKQVSPTRST